MFQITHVTAKSPRFLSKAFKLSKEGELVVAPGGRLFEGMGRIERFDSFKDFFSLIQNLSSNEALIYGIPKNSPSRFDIVTRKTYEEKIKELPTLAKTRSLIPRTKDFFDWNQGPGVLTLDYDPYGKPLTKDELLNIVYSVVPDLKKTAHVWKPSVSSCIKNEGTGQQYRGIKGQRIYIAVEKASDVPRAGQALFERLWLARHGFINVSKSGALLVRTLIDDSIWQAERLDFIGKAHLEKPLIQNAPTPELLGLDGRLLDSQRLIPDLTKDERRLYLQLVRDAKEEKKPEQEKKQEEWIKEREKECPAESLESKRVALREGILRGDFVVTLSNGENVTVDDMLKDPKRYHGRKGPDPLEKDYHNSKDIAFYNLSKERPYVHSFAHGGHKLFLQGSEPVMKKYMETIQKIFPQRQNVSIKNDDPSSGPSFLKQFRCRGQNEERER